MSVKILANDGISPSGKEQLEAAGYTVITEKVDQEDLADAINNHDYKVLLVRSATKVREQLIDACPGLEMIGRGGVGMDNIDVEYARNKGITVFNTPASSSQAVAELVMAHMFSISRGLYDSNRNMPSNGTTEFKALKKKYGKGVELRGKTLGIMGFGRIGQNVAKYALGSGMKVIAYDLYPVDTVLDLGIEGTDAKVNIKTTSKEEVLSHSDFITLHIPAQEDGSPAIGKKEFDSMKDGVFLINAARGGVVNEDDMIEALKSGKVAHAAIDVFVNEPTPREDILSLENVSLSPHIGAATVEAQDRIGGEIADIVSNHYNSK